MRLVPWRKPPEQERTTYPIVTLDGWFDALANLGMSGALQTLPGDKQELIGHDFQGLVRQAYKSDGVVFACMLVRMLVFSEARIAYQHMRGGRPADVWGDQSLEMFETPWRGGTTGDLLSRAIQYADLAGNAFFARRPTGLMPLRPDWVDIVIGSMSDTEIGAWDVDSEVLGYIYTPGGRHSGRESTAFLADEVAHFAPIPDPEAQFRGMSWLTPIIRELMADKAATQHKLKFFENAATPNMVIKLDTSDLEKYTAWVERFREDHEGAQNAHRTVFLGAGADVTSVGANMQQMDFKAVQGAGETRVAAAASVPPVLVGLSEGLASATYSNYGMARRRFSDATMRPLWRNFCGSMQRISNTPSGSRLWFDESGIAFLREDQKDAAQILSLNSVAIKQLVDAGYDAASVIDAVTAGDLSRLIHTGLFSVQLQPAGTTAPAAAGATNGTIPARQIEEILALTAGE